MQFIVNSIIFSSAYNDVVGRSTSYSVLLTEWIPLTKEKYVIHMPSGVGKKAINRIFSIMPPIPLALPVKERDLRFSPDLNGLLLVLVSRFPSFR